MLVILSQGVLSKIIYHIVAQSEPEVVLEQIRTYCDDIEVFLSNSTDLNNVDYPKIAKHAQIMEEESLRYVYLP